ncbi:RNA polymerase recycling motor ATPase HelR [Skermania piniformis]|uniref:RNA polymerase recycling motor ATPase HelR n=1 Tax=Skermania pinensis TaxID=39122 RepID=UPI00082ED7D3|nr:RNA polymerase recycling motor ATPase HelR [Skermania piniformis]
MNRNSAFDLPDRLARKADPTLIEPDERHFGVIARSLDHAVTTLRRRLDEIRSAPVRAGQEALERDLEVHRITARLRALRRYRLDLCLGHVVPADTGEPVYIGRQGLLDEAGNPLLIDWRSPDAESFFAATHANPMNLIRRRRYRWRGGRVVDYWDEAFTADALATDPALDDQSAFLAELGAGRSPRMRDVLGTIAADQDAIIRAGSRGALVVDGGPGTGKTVVALHRTAYLRYSDPRLRHAVLFVGPHEPYLAYVADVLPSLGEDSVQLATLRDLVAEGAAAEPEPDPAVARLKATAELVQAIEAAVGFYEQPPTAPMTVVTEYADIPLTGADWAEAFRAPEPGTPHNEAREQIRALLYTILIDRCDADVPAEQLRNELQRNDELRDVLDGSWTLIEAADLVGDLWSVPAYLRLAAPWLTPTEVQLLQRAEPQRWTIADLPLLDAARRRLGDPGAARRAQRRTAMLAAERQEMNRVVGDLIAADDSELLVMSMLRGDDLRAALDDESGLPRTESDRLAGPFAHIVVDEAQELTDAEWQMLRQRCPSGSLTVVGDRAQARRGFTESWPERLGRIGLDRITEAALTVNYRTPEEVMAEAEPVIRAALPDANVPTSIRRTGIPVRHGPTTELVSVIEHWLAEHADGIACIIGDPGFADGQRVRSLDPQSVKGLEFDLVVLVAPERFGAGIAGAVDRYVAMTRATGQLVVLSDR